MALQECPAAPLFYGICIVMLLFCLLDGYGAVE